MPALIFLGGALATLCTTIIPYTFALFNLMTPNPRLVGSYRAF